VVSISSEAPAFVHGVVTELAGPGLRVEAPLQVQTGDRILVAFRAVGMVWPRGTTGGGNGEFLIEDVGEVKHCQSTGVGVSIALELTGVSETEIDELVRVTNLISSNTNGQNNRGKQDARNATGRPAVMQEV